MLGRALSAASRSDRLRRVATEVPVARRVAMRFVAGEELADALAVARALNDRGAAVSLDHLGEAITDPHVAEDAADAYLEALDRIHLEDLDASVSVKLTQLGLGVDDQGCRDRLARIAEAAAQRDRHVTVDMEGSDHTGATVELVLRLRREGHDNVGCAVQAYLYRTGSDVERLVDAGASLRLCKGAYAEPEHLAWQRAADVDRNFLRLADRLLRSDTFPRFATHDHRLVARIRTLAPRYGRAPDGFELQLLHGVREPLRRQLVDAGHRVRIYVPYGTEWYPYLVRRLAERPANLTFFLRALVGRRGRGDG